VLRLIGLALSIGLADSLNPSTIAPALYLAAGSDARNKVIEFTAAVFIVYLVGGAAIALGPGQLLLSALPHPDRDTRWLLEVIAGAAMLVAAAYLWRRRQHLARRPLPTVNPDGKSGALLGATISAVELPTAFPYFAVIAAIVGSGTHPATQLALLLLFNVCFVAPLLALAAVLTWAPDRSRQVITRAREWMERRWPVVLAGLLAVAGVFVIWLGASGLGGQFVRHHPRFMRHIPTILR
jgi:cytochrome c biogenesis protein CcdA